MEMPKSKRISTMKRLRKVKSTLQCLANRLFLKYSTTRKNPFLILSLARLWKNPKAVQTGQIGRPKRN
jgi:hypothetical protein